jgi:hypothetical protein
MVTKSKPKATKNPERDANDLEGDPEENVPCFIRVKRREKARYYEVFGKSDMRSFSDWVRVVLNQHCRKAEKE